MSLVSVRVFGRRELVARIQRRQPMVENCCISIAGPEAERVPAMRQELAIIQAAFPRVLSLRFHDTNLCQDDLGRQLTPPSQQDMARIVTFVNETHARSTGYVIHCHAGVSRSTATALAVLFLLGHTEESAVAELRRIRPQAAPLACLTSYFDDLIGSRLTELVPAIHQYAHQHMLNELVSELSTIPHA